MTARPPFEAIVVSLFPEVFPGPLGVSLVGKALENGLWRLKTLDFREFARDKRRSVDDTPAGGGPGLVMRADVAGAAIDHAKALAPTGAPVLYLSPRGRPLSQAMAKTLSDGPGAIFLCGRFEGVDQRALEARNVEEICVGDAVYTGGEIPAMAVIDAVVRLLPGVVGDPASLYEESFAAGLLEHPHYTRPRLWEGRAIPEVLLSGDHAAIDAWRRAQSEALTKKRRPDLWSAIQDEAAQRGVASAGPPEQSDEARAAAAPRDTGDER